MNGKVSNSQMMMNGSCNDKAETKEGGGVQQTTDEKITESMTTNSNDDHDTNVDNDVDEERTSSDSSIELTHDPLTGSVNVSTAETERAEEEATSNEEMMKDESDEQCQLWSTTNNNYTNNNNDDDIIQESGGIEVNANTTAFGDIWSTEAFGFATTSPLKDLLDTNNFTLVDLLAQDELLQELRGCEIKLIEYFNKEEVVAGLVECLMIEVPDGGSLMGKERWVVEEEQRRRALSVRQNKLLLDEKEREKKLAAANSISDNNNPASPEMEDKKKATLFDASSPKQESDSLHIEAKWNSPPNNNTSSFFPSSPTNNNNEGEEQQRTPLEEYDMRFIRYPYMACEVLCSEVGSTIDILIDGYVDDDDDDIDVIDNNNNHHDNNSSSGVIHDEEDSLLGDNNNNNNEEEGEERRDGGTMKTSMREVKGEEEYHDMNDEANSNNESGSNTSTSSAAYSTVPTPMQPPPHIHPHPSTTTQQQPPLSRKQRMVPKKRILDILFATLINTPPISSSSTSTTTTACLDDRRAGYFEKILNVLYRKRPQAMCDYMNTTLIVTTESMGMAKYILGNLTMGGVMQQDGRSTASSTNNTSGDGHEKDGIGKSASYVSLSRQMSSSDHDDNNATATPTPPPSKTPTTLIDPNCKFPMPTTPPMLMCALFDHMHSYSMMHIVQQLLLPSPVRQMQSQKQNEVGGGATPIPSENDDKETTTTDGNSNNDNDPETSMKDDDEDDNNPTNAMNNQFMNTLNQMNGIGMMDDDDDNDDDDDMEDVDDPMHHIFQCDWLEQYTNHALELLLRRLEGDTTSFMVGYGFPVGYNVNDLNGRGSNGTTCVGGEGDAEMKSETSSQQQQQQQQRQEEESLSCSQHASEILITIIQNSPLDSRVMLTLSSNPALQRIINLICPPPSSPKTTEEVDDFSAHESIMTCAITVLESLVLQLGGYGAVATTTTGLTTTTTTSASGNNSGNESGGDTSMAEDNTAQMGRQSSISEVQEATTWTLIQHVPALLDRLSTLLTHPITKTWIIPAQYSNSQPRAILGTSRLRILRLIESLVLLGDTAVDLALQDSDCLEKCLELFWQFEWCSMLHQSAANLLVHVFEGGECRSGLQQYFLIRCKLLERLMDSFEGDNSMSCSATDDNNPLVAGETSRTSTSGNQGDDYDDDDVAIGESDNADQAEDGDDDVAPVSEDDVDSAMEKECQEKGDAIIGIATEEDGGDDDNDNDGGGVNESGDLVTINSSTTSPQQQQLPPNQICFRKGYMGHVIIICQALVHACNNNTTSDEAVSDPNAGCNDTEEVEERLNSSPLSSPLQSADELDGICATSSFETSAIQAAAHAIDDSNSCSSNSKKRKDRSPVRSEDIKRLASSPNPSSDCDDLFSSPTSPIPKVPPVAQSPSNHKAAEECKSSNQAQSPLSIDNILRQHTLYDKWQDFVSSVLASEMSVQSTPLGGQQTTNQNNAIGFGGMMPSVINDNSDSDFLDIDQASSIGGDAIGGLIVGEIDMDENDLDIAASMMEALSLPPTANGSAGSSQPAGHSRRRGVSLLGGSTDTTASEKKGTGIGNFGSVIEQPGGFKDCYVYDDPLGGFHPFDSADSSDEDEKNSSEEEDGFMSDAMVVSKDDGDVSKQEGSGDGKKNGNIAKSGSSSSDEESGDNDEDDDDDDDDDDDVPVMDLFAGFANFEDAFDDHGNDPFGSSNEKESSGDDIFSSNNDGSGNKKDDPFFAESPFDLVDSLSSEEAETEDNGKAHGGKAS